MPVHLGRELHLSCSGYSTFVTHNLRSPGLLGSRQVLSDRGPAAAAVAAQSRHLQSWPGHMRP
eukprot:5413452-Amphidinium_carterae.1